MKMRKNCAVAQQIKPFRSGTGASNLPGGRPLLLLCRISLISGVVICFLRRCGNGTFFMSSLQWVENCSSTLLLVYSAHCIALPHGVIFGFVCLRFLTSDLNSHRKSYWHLNFSCFFSCLGYSCDSILLYFSFHCTLIIFSLSYCIVTCPKNLTSINCFDPVMYEIWLAFSQ